MYSLFTVCMLTGLLYAVDSMQFTNTCRLEAITDNWVLVTCNGNDDASGQETWLDNNGERHNITAQEIVTMRSIACFCKENDAGFTVRLDSDIIIPMSRKQAVKLCDKVAL